MKRFEFIAAIGLLAGSSAWAAPLATAARTVIPKDVQQIICVDYRTLKASPTALALKERVLPPNIKEFETTVQDLGLDPEKDIESLTFAAFRTPKGETQVIGIAQGTFPATKVTQKFKAKKVKGTKYRTSLIYPAGNMEMSFLDDYTMLFGENAALRTALDARDGEAETLASNSQMTDLVNDADNGPVWSVLDATGTQNIIHSALGDAAQLADYNVIKKRLLGSRYSMDFTNGVHFDLDVLTSDTITATTLSSLIKAGLMYRRMTSNSSDDKVALDAMSVDSNSDRLLVHFKTDDKQFQTLLKSDLFAAVSK